MAEHYVASGLYDLPNQQWLRRRSEAALEPGLPIVDAHHHLWDRTSSRYLLDEILGDVGSGHNVTLVGIDVAALNESMFAFD